MAICPVVNKNIASTRMIQMKTISHCPDHNTDVATGSWAGEEEAGLPPKPEEDGGIHLGQRDSGLDSMTKEILMQTKMKNNSSIQCCVLQFSSFHTNQGTSEEIYGEVRERTSLPPCWMTCTNKVTTIQNYTLAIFIFFSSSDLPLTGGLQRN